MSKRIVHLSDATHAAFKAKCRAKGVRMTDVANRLIREWLGSDKTKLIETEEEKESTVKPWSEPPFWATR